MKIVFMGTPDFAEPSLQALLDAGHEVAAVYTQPDKPQGRKQVLTAPPVKELALKHGVQPRCEIPNTQAAQYYIDLGVRHFCVGDQVNALRGFWNTQGPEMRKIADAL